MQRRYQPDGVVTKKAQSLIARPTQQTSHPIGYVVVIYLN
jgi:hypothetical protein